MFGISFFEFGLILFVIFGVLSPKEAVKAIRAVRNFILNIRKEWDQYMNYLDNDNDNDTKVVYTHNTKEIYIMDENNQLRRAYDIESIRKEITQSNNKLKRSNKTNKSIGSKKKYKK